MFKRFSYKHFVVVLCAVTVGAVYAPHAFADTANYTWTDLHGAGNPGWVNLSSNANGSVLGAVVFQGDIYISTTTGATWTDEASAGNRQWIDITSSADGSVLAAVASPDYIYVSTTTGSTWTTETTSGSRNWQSIAASSNGSVMVAGDGGGYVYVSTSTGATWTAETSAGSRGWQAVASNASGSVLAAAPFGGQIYISTSTGATWSVASSSPNEDWIWLATSADGSHIIAAAYSDTTFSFTNGTIWMSSDYGNTWVQQSVPLEGWYTVTMSSDGQRLSAAAENTYGLIGTAHLGPFYTSIDGGSHWIQESQLGSAGWSAAAATADGSRLFALSNDVWTGTIGVGGVPNNATSPPAPPILSVSITGSTTANVQLSTQQTNGISALGFEYLVPGTATTTKNFSIGGPTAVTTPLSGLLCGTSYSIWGYAVNALGTTNTTPQTLTTQSCGATTPASSRGGGISQTTSAASGAIVHAVSTPSVTSTTTRTTTVPLFTKDLKRGDTGAEVTALQNFLIKMASGPAAAALARSGVSGYFGSLTKAALIEFQKAAGITPASGYFGSLTRAYIAAH